MGDALFVHMEAPDHTSLLRRAYDARGRAILENEWLEGRVGLPLALTLRPRLTLFLSLRLSLTLALSLALSLGLSLSLPPTPAPTPAPHPAGHSGRPPL